MTKKHSKITKEQPNSEQYGGVQDDGLRIHQHGHARAQRVPIVHLLDEANHDFLLRMLLVVILFETTFCQTEMRAGNRIKEKM